ncbi:MAG: glycosyltransferase, partial [Acidimicrobiales bacterium]
MTNVTLVVAIVPAKDRADSVGATVRALRGLPQVGRVLVVDDGSTDRTAAEALAAGAEVLRLPSNRGKSGAVAAGVAACPAADVFLLIDADLGGTAAAADRLLEPVLADQADLVVGVLPAGRRRSGLGSVR